MGSAAKGNQAIMYERLLKLLELKVILWLSIVEEKIVVEKERDQDGNQKQGKEDVTVWVS